MAATGTSRLGEYFSGPATDRDGSHSKEASKETSEKELGRSKAQRTHMGKQETFAGSSQTVCQRSEGASVLLSCAACARNHPNVCPIVRTWKQGDVETCQRVSCWRLCEGCQLLHCRGAHRRPLACQQNLVVPFSEALERGTASRLMRGKSDPRWYLKTTQLPAEGSALQLRLDQHLESS